MNARVVALVALATAVTLTSVAAAGPNAAKQRVAIDMKLWPQKTFVFTPLQAGVGVAPEPKQHVPGVHVVRPLAQQIRPGLQIVDDMRNRVVEGVVTDVEVLMQLSS